MSTGLAVGFISIFFRVHRTFLLSRLSFLLHRVKSRVGGNAFAHFCQIKQAALSGSVTTLQCRPMLVVSRLRLAHAFLVAREDWICRWPPWQDTRPRLRLVLCINAFTAICMQVARRDLPENSLCCQLPCRDENDEMVVKVRSIAVIFPLK